MRLLTLNQGAAKAGMLGAASFDAALLASLDRAADLEVHCLQTPESSLAQRLGQRPWWPLAAFDLDLHTPRWQTVESRKARRTVLDWIASHGDPDVLLVNTQSVSFSLSDVMRRVPTVLSVDVLTAEWNAMAIWRQHRPYSHALLAPSIRKEAAALERAALVLAWSSWAAAQVSRLQPRANVIAHHPGIDTGVYRPTARRARVRPAVLFIGGRFAAKGGALLLEALGRHLGVDVDLHVVTGDVVAERPGVTVHRLVPGAPALLDLLQQADVLCLPTRGDASPWVILEAMACGTPVVASPVGAITEMLDGGRAGLLCENKDPRMLREQIMGLLANLARREELSARGLKHVARHYDARQRGEVLADLLRGTMKVSPA